MTDDAATLEPELLDDAAGVLAEVGRRTDDPEVRAGVTAATEALDEARGQTVAEFLGRLVSRGPRP